MSERKRGGGHRDILLNFCKNRKTYIGTQIRKKNKILATVVGFNRRSNTDMRKCWGEAVDGYQLNTRKIC